MGACLSCLGLSSPKDRDSESRRLLDDPYGPYSGYGTSNQGPTNQQYGVSGQPVNLEDAKREQEALANITRWTSNTVVDIFPHQPDAVSPIPGDKSSRSRVYPTSRPHSQASSGSRHAPSHHSRQIGSIGKSSPEHPKLFSKLEIDLS